MKPTSRQLKEWFEYLWRNKAVYLWGGNGERITKQLTDRLYSIFRSASYNKKYYDNKYKEGVGRIGADCSGAFCPVSGFDATASGYYDRCRIKGAIGKIPHHKICQVFRKSLSGKIVHIGLYTGDGYTIEMKSSKANVHREKLNKLRWTYYGIPDWMEEVNPYPEPIKTIYKGCEGEDVKWVQYELCENGIIVDVDGQCGKKTDKAIRDYQKKHGLTVDGRCGSATRKNMKA